MESLLPLYDRFLSPESTQYVVCVYKVRGIERAKPPPQSLHVTRACQSPPSAPSRLPHDGAASQGFNALTNLEYVLHFPDNRCGGVEEEGHPKGRPWVAQRGPLPGMLPGVARPCNLVIHPIPVPASERSCPADSATCLLRLAVTLLSPQDGSRRPC